MELSRKIRREIAASPPTSIRDYHVAAFARTVATAIADNISRSLTESLVGQGLPCNAHTGGFPGRGAGSPEAWLDPKVVPIGEAILRKRDSAIHGVINYKGS